MKRILVAAVLAGCTQVARPTPPEAAPPPSREEPRSAPQSLLEGVVATAGRQHYAPAGSPKPRRLDRFEPVRIHGRRGTCYAVGLALEPGAQWSAFAQRNVGWSSSGDPQTTVLVDLPRRGPVKDVRSAFNEIGCPVRNTDIELDLWAFHGYAASRARVHDLGRGEVLVQLFVRPIALADLDRLEEDRQAREAKLVGDSVREACGECQPAIGSCTEAALQSRPSPCEALIECLQGTDATARQCLSLTR
jgi:hypothetical protein